MARSLSLQQKVSLTLLAVMAVLAVFSYVILTLVVEPAFDRLEIAGARTNLVRAERAIQNELDNLAAIVNDWALWDDAYAYARGDYPEFQRSNLDRPTLENLDLHLLLIYDATGELLWGQMVHDGEVKDHRLLGVFGPDATTSAKLLSRQGADTAFSGLLRTGLGPMLVSSSPILTSFDEGPMAGTMIMGAFMDRALLDSLRERTEVSIDWQLLEPGAPGPPVPLNAGGSGTIVHDSSEREIRSSGVLDDLYGEPLVELRVTTPRSISALGSQTVDGALTFLAIAGIVVATVTWLLLRSIIVLPLEGLASHIVNIRESGDLTHRLELQRNDEIGALANEFDKMTAEVHDARQALLEQSFRAGKADAAAEVLHNIRNAMTPLINGLDRLGRHFRVADSLQVGRAVEELGGPGCPPERRGKLKQYVDSAFKYVRETCHEASDELEVISKQARQVRAILADQERHANVAPVIESLELDEVLDEAILVIPKPEAADVELRLQDRLGRIRVRAHRVGLLQVLGNLILNAYEAIQRGQSDGGTIDLSASVETVDDQPMVRLTVRDSGCGFDEQVGRRIFQRGYSSKKGHMSGLGLHWCANALAGMGGKIDAESSGPGLGAAFHVLLPAAHGG